MPGPWPLKILFPRILLRHPDPVEIEEVMIALGVPYDGFVTARKTFRAVQAVFKMPDDPVSHFHSQALEDRVQENIQRQDRSVFDIIANLPANGAIVRKDSMTFIDDAGLPVEIRLQRLAFFVFLADVVGGRGKHERHRSGGNGSKKIETVAMKRNGFHFTRTEKRNGRNRIAGRASVFRREV